jgi:hypothetical protein
MSLQKGDGMKAMRGVVTGLFIVSTALQGIAGPLARITLLEGNASVLKVGAKDWRPARPNLPLKKGDQIYTREESFVEIRFATGAVVRMNESSKVRVEALSEDESKASSNLGDVWVSMKKMVKKKEFEISTPTAVAAIRGTAFNLSTDEDSTSSVSVYDGKVAVGPAASSESDKSEVQQPRSMEPTEIPGPEEIPGPYEVSLEEWTEIVAGQQITIRKDGKFAKEKFDIQKTAATQDFVKKNLELDKKMKDE